jgi:tape measure domain-containing protein
MANKAEFEVELIDDVSRPAKKAEGALVRLKGGLNRFNNSAFGRATQGLATFTKNAVTVGAVVGGALVGGITAAAVGMVDFGQRSRQAFGLLAKEGEVPEQLFQRSLQLAEDFGLQMKDTAKQVQKFRALQFSQKQSEALIKMGADMMALGANSEEVSRVFAQLGQIKAKDTLQTEELRTLAESGVSTQVVFAALAKQLGKTEGAIKDMISKGEITGSQALNAIGTAILFKTGTKQFGEAGKKIADSTLSGMATQFRAKTQRAFLGVADAAAPAINRVAKAIFGDLKSLFEGPKLSVEEQVASQAFGNRGGAAPLPPLFQKIADAVAGVAKAVEKALPVVKSFLKGFEKGAAEAWKEFSGAFSEVAGILGGSEGERTLKMSEALGKSFGFLAVATGAVAMAFTAVGVALALVANFAMKVVINFVDSLGEALASIFFPFVDAFENIKAILGNEEMSIGEKGFAIGKAIVMGIVRGMQAFALAPINQAKRLVGGVVNAATETLGIKSPSKVFADIGKNTALGFSNGLLDLPTQNIIHSTLGNDNGLDAPVRGNLSGAGGQQQAAGGGGNRTMVVHLKVAAPPGATKEAGVQYGKGISEGIYETIHEFFDDITIEEAV